MRNRISGQFQGISKIKRHVRKQQTSTIKVLRPLKDKERLRDMLQKKEGICSLNVTWKDGLDSGIEKH